MGSKTNVVVPKDLGDVSSYCKIWLEIKIARDVADLPAVIAIPTESGSRTSNTLLNGTWPWEEKPLNTANVGSTASLRMISNPISMAGSSRNSARSKVVAAIGLQSKQNNEILPLDMMQCIIPTIEIFDGRFEAKVDRKKVEAFEGGKGGVLRNEFPHLANNLVKGVDLSVEKSFLCLIRLQ